MTHEVENLIRQYEQRRIGRRELVGALIALVASGGAEVVRAQTARVTQVAQGRSLNHVSISVSDVERSARFYQDLLGLDIVSRPGNGGINLGLSDGFLGCYSTTGQVGRASHFCIGVDDYDPVRIAEAMTRAGIQARVDTNPRNRTSGGDQLYFNDPDGTAVQLSANGYQG
jgi:catechol 2,3-dioxygenase-like lactoylglutathione lyase family enzyme